MKRALALFAVVLAFGFGALAIGSISGSWDFELQVTPSTNDISITENVLSLTYTDFDWSFTGELDIIEDSFALGFAGALGIFQIEGEMEFDFTTPDYNKTKLKADIDFAGMKFTTEIKHYSADDLPSDWTDYCTQTPSEGMILYILSTEVDIFSLDVTFVDCCSGIEFYDITVALSGLGLCCDITYDVEVYFTKEGFQYVLFSVDKLFELCCGISFGVEVEYGVDYKQVTPNFSFDFPAGECLDVGFTLGVVDDITIESLTLDYFGITCSLGDCSSLLFGTVFTGKEVGTITIDGDTFVIIAPNAPSAWGLRHSFVEEEIAYFEYETLQFEACGPACCGGTWKTYIKAYWGTCYTYDNGWEPVPTLFGLSRLLADVDIPLWEGFVIKFGMSYDLLLKTTDVTIGWSFSF